MTGAPLSRRRYWTKKVARHAVAAATAAGRSAMPRTVGARVRVLTYHRFGRVPRDPFSVDPRAFDAQMRWLAREGRAIGLDDLEAFVRGERPLPDGAVLVTIDDGCRSTLTEAQPILAAHAVPAVAFVVAGTLGIGGEPVAEQPEAYLTPDELGRLAEGGVKIGSHAVRHRSLGPMSLAQARDEAYRSKALLEARIGVEVTSFAYPFGTRADFNDVTARALADAGYTIAFTSQHGAIARGAEPLALPRIKVESGEGGRMFRALCRGGLDAWGLVDRGLWRVQVAGRPP